MTKITKRINIALFTALVATATAFTLPSAQAQGQGFQPGQDARGDRGGRGERGQRGERRFARLDVNEDGELSLTEMTNLAAKAERVLARKDADDDGVLSLAEFEQNRHGNMVDLSAIADEIVQCVTDLKAETGNELIIIPDADRFGSAGDKFAAIDDNADDAINLGELEAAMTDRATNAFAAMDADEDDAVTLEEFTAHKASRRASKMAIRECVHQINDGE